MLNNLIKSVAIAATLTMAPTQFAAASNYIHGFHIDSPAVIGTSWKTTQRTTLWAEPYDVATQLLTIPAGARLQAQSKFNPTATGVYVRVTYNGMRGWVEDRMIRRAKGGGTVQTGHAPSGVTYSVANVNHWASLRQSPSTGSYRMAKVPRGASVYTTGRKTYSGGHNWLSVSYNNTQGWMPTRYLRKGGGYAGNGGGGGNTGIANPSGGYPVGNYEVTNVNNWASLRSRTSRSSQRMAKVPRGNYVYYSGERRYSGGETWLRVNYSGWTGWMPVQYLRF